MAGIREGSAIRLRGLVRGLLYVASLLVSTVGVAGTPHLTLDINTQRPPLSSNPAPLGKLGNSLYFIAQYAPGWDTAALFKTDGTDAGTIKVKDIHGYGVWTRFSPWRPPLYTKPTLFIAAGSKAYFLAKDNATGQEVWVTDGTEAGTHIVADLYPGPGPGSDPDNFDPDLVPSPILLGLVGTDLIFGEPTSATNWQIYRTDGTSAGTRALTSFAPSTYNVVNDVVSANGKVYVSVSGGCCTALWVTDGTTAGTHEIGGSGSPPSHLQASSLTVSGNSILFKGQGILYKVDTASDTVQSIAATQSNGFSPGGIAVMNGYSLFAGGDSEPWRTDGTPGGTARVKAIGSGVGGTGSMGLSYVRVTRVGTYAVFLADDGQHGPFLWSSDGTAQGTVPLIAAPTNPSSSLDPLLGVVGTHAYYWVYDGSGYQIVVTDGTVPGTHVLSGIGTIKANARSDKNEVAGDDTLTFLYIGDVVVLPGGFKVPVKRLFGYSPQTNTVTPLGDGNFDDRPVQVLFDNGRLFFRKYDAVTGYEPWLSDGTVAGTHLVKNVEPETVTSGSNPGTFVDFGGQLAFLADDGVNGTRIWLSDGTATGTRLLANVSPDNGASSPMNLAVMNGALYFFATDQAGQWHYMRVAKEGALPEVLAPLVPVPVESVPLTLPSSCNNRRTAVLNGVLYFVAAPQLAMGPVLYKTDGTAGGTVRVTGQMSASPCDPITAANRVFFTTTEPKLWASDGTAAGTVQVADLSGSAYVSLSTPPVLNGALYFSTNDGQSGPRLWKSDGTLGGTVETAHFVPPHDAVGSAYPVGVLNGKLLLQVGWSGAPGWHLTVSDGTVAGTATPLSTPPISGVTVMGSKAYFSVQESTYQLWVTDGTQAGTRMLQDMGPQSTDNPQSFATPAWFRDFHGVTFFEMRDGNQKGQVFQTDGTVSGTKLVATIGYAPLVNYAYNFRPALVVGQNLFYSTLDPVVGGELFALPNDAPVAVNDSATSENGTAVTINVLANDADSDGSIDPTSIKITTNPVHGSVSVDAKGSIVYTPVAGYSGQDVFAYTVVDNQGAVSAPATVTVTVTPAVTVNGDGTSGSKGGGGAVGYWEMVILLALTGLRMASTRIRRTMSPRYDWRPATLSG